jgi:hypothetical protein
MVILMRSRSQIPFLQIFLHAWSLNHPPLSFSFLIYCRQESLNPLLAFLSPLLDYQPSFLWFRFQNTALFLILCL